MGVDSLLRFAKESLRVEEDILATLGGEKCAEVVAIQNFHWNGQYFLLSYNI